jgi:iron-sulfur cluster assembly protein
MLRITQKAIQKILDRNQASLHIYVEKGGCADYKYGFTFDHTICIEPTEYKFGSISILVNQADVELMEHVEIDYKSSLVSEKFTVNIDENIEKCGCGISFKR